jgi:pimeloyl-ACP methyl ester carboxylesterase
MFLRAWLKKHPERCVVLVGHSTGALVATCLAWLFACSPGSKTVSRVSGVVLIAPAFKLRSQRDIHLLSIVLFFYYLICPLAILGVTVAFPRLFVLGVASLLLHTVVVPGIWIFNGEQRANFRESDSRAYSSAKRRELFMAIMILGFLMTPVALTCIALFLGFAAAKYLYLVFIGLQLARLFFVMVSPDKVKMEPSSSTSYNWLPIITAANLLLLQMLACRVLPRLSLPVLVIEGKDDAVVHLPPSILAKFPRSMVTHLVVEGMGHSEFTVEQQRELAHTVTEWLEENIGGNRPCNASVEVDGECKSLRA